MEARKSLVCLNRKKRMVEAQRGDMVGYRQERKSGARCQGLWAQEDFGFYSEGREGPLQHFEQVTNEIRSLR